jgi:hypothetical protein
VNGRILYETFTVEQGEARSAGDRRIYTGPFCDRCNLREPTQEVQATDSQSRTLVAKLCTECSNAWKKFRSNCQHAARLAPSGIAAPSVRLPSGAEYRVRPTLRRKS